MPAAGAGGRDAPAASTLGRGGWGPGEEQPRGTITATEGAAKVRWNTVAAQHEHNYLKQNLDMHRDFQMPSLFNLHY